MVLLVFLREPFLEEGDKKILGGGCEKLREKHEYNSARPQNCCCNPRPLNSVRGAHE